MALEKLVDQVGKVLGTDGEIRRHRLPHGLGLAYAGDRQDGRLTLSRAGREAIPSKEASLIQQAFRDVVRRRLGAGVTFATLCNEKREWNGRVCWVWMFRVTLGRQLSLLDELML